MYKLMYKLLCRCCSNLCTLYAMEIFLRERNRKRKVWTQNAQECFWTIVTREVLIVSY